MARPNTGQALPTPAVVTMASRIALGGGLRLSAVGAAASGVSPWSDAANFLLCYPLTLEVQTPLYKGLWLNGSAAGNATEASILDEAFKVLATTGSGTGSGANAAQARALTTTPTVLPPGRYYCGMTHNATTTNQLFRWSVATTGIAFFMAAGCFKAAATAGSITVGNTLTPADLTNVAFPVFGFITRSAYDA